MVSSVQVSELAVRVVSFLVVVASGVVHSKIYENNRLFTVSHSNNNKNIMDDPENDEIALVPVTRYV